MARDLESKGLLHPGRFMTLYGATYDETFKIAQFYDAQYADAIILSSREPHRQENLIRQERIAFTSAPFKIQKILGKATSPTAVVMRHDQVYAVGTDTRSAYDPYSTAEVNGVRAACIRNRKDGAFASWEVDGELYSTNPQIGPLLFAEAGWTKIGLVKSVKMPKDLAAKQFVTRETPDLGNADFLRVIAGGYEHPLSSIHVVRDEGFKNTAQPQWAEMLRVNGEQLYNGAAVSPAVEAMRNSFTCYRFAARDLCACSHGHAAAHRPIQLLETLNPKRGVA